MSKILTLIIAGTLASQALAQSPAPKNAETSYQSGLAAEQAGDPVAAGNHYRDALKIDPKHANARYSLGQLKLTSASIATKGREAKFGSVMIPVFQLEEASLQEALDAFGMLIEKQSNEQVTPNFVIQDPKNLLAGRKVTLNLKNTPSKGVLQYLMEQTGAKARHDEYAIVIVPR